MRVSIDKDWGINLSLRFLFISVGALLSDPMPYQILKSLSPIEQLLWMVCQTIVGRPSSYGNLGTLIPARGNTRTKVNAIIHMMNCRYCFKKLSRRHNRCNLRQREPCEWSYRDYELKALRNDIATKEWSLNLTEIRIGTGRLTVRFLKILNDPFLHKNL